MVPQHADGDASQIVYSQEGTSRSTEGQEIRFDDVALDSFNDYTFNTNSIDDSLFSAWITDTPIQQSLDTGTSSRSRSHANCESSFLKTAPNHSTEVLNSFPRIK